VRAPQLQTLYPTLTRHNLILPPRATGAAEALGCRANAAAASICPAGRRRLGSPAANCTSSKPGGRLPDEPAARCAVALARRGRIGPAAR